MIRIQHHPEQLRIDTDIKFIDKDGVETIAPVVVLVGMTRVEEKNKYNFYKIAESLFNRDFILDKRIKITTTKKPWYKFW